MNGAQNLLDTLIASGVEVCFANPGTSEMQLVSAIGNSEGMRAVLCLFEGVVSGAADGYARMSGKPALTLLHLGSGFSNSMANLHNAKRASVPVVNMVGDHASYHLQYDAPLTSDVAAHARISSAWVRTATSADDLAQAGAEAVQAATTGAGKVATFIAPADWTWSEATKKVPALPRPAREPVTAAAIDEACAALRSGRPAALLLGGDALYEENLAHAGRIAAATGARLISVAFPTRLQRGVGRVKIERLPYFAEQAAAFLEGLEHLVLVGAKSPVSFFAYPGKASWLTPEACATHHLAGIDQDIGAALAELASRLAPDREATVAEALPPPPAPRGDLTPAAIGQTLCALIPEHAIVSDEANTCSLGTFPLTAHAAPHDWLALTGGAIGQGLPVALGAAIACPDRKVIALEADGSAMYTLQSLWTMARERTDVTVVLFNNRSYAILNIELARVGASKPTAKTLSMLDLSRPDIDWVALASGLGVPATRASTAEEFHAQFAAAMATRGPRFIEAMVVQQLPG